MAISVSLGAAQLAVGHDLTVSQDPAGASEAVNRDSKADRANGSAGSAAPTRTISLRLDVLSDTSVLIRLPVAEQTANEASKEARNGPSVPLTKSLDRKVACEPVVSVLTEVARQLQPGRCIT
jgi:hypothetical protein